MMLFFHWYKFYKEILLCFYFLVTWRYSSYQKVRIRFNSPYLHNFKINNFISYHPLKKMLVFLSIFMNWLNIFDRFPSTVIKMRKSCFIFSGFDCVLFFLYSFRSGCSRHNNIHLWLIPVYWCQYFTTLNELWKPSI